MRALLLGDTHGDAGAVNYARKMANIEGCKYIIQLGDFSYYWCGRDTTHLWSDKSKFPNVEVIFLPGNHEDWAQLDKLTPGNSHKMVTYLGRVNLLNLDGLNVLTVGGAFSIDQGGRKLGVDYFQQEEITEADINRAFELVDKFGRIDIILSHDAPETQPLVDHMNIMATYWGGLHPKLEQGSATQRRAIEAIVAKAKPKLLVHGHYHYRYESTYMNTKIVGLDCNGTGRKSIYVLDTEEWNGKNR